MDISILPQLQRPPREAQPTVQVKLDVPLPASVAGKAALTVKVVSSQPNGQAQLSLPDGKVIAATLTPPANPGSSLTLTPPASNPLLAVAKLIPPPPAAAVAPQATPAPVVAPQPNITLAAPPNPLPAGPVLVVPPPSVVLPQGQVIFTVSSPPNAVGQQTAVVSQPATPQQPIPAPNGEALKVKIETGLPLPVGSKVAATVPAAPQPATTGQPVPVAVQAQAVQVPLVTPQGQVVVVNPPPAPPTPTFIAALKVLVPQNQPTQAAPLPLNQPVQARVLAPPTPTPTPNAAASQPIVLANGQTAVVQLPPALPAPSVAARPGFLAQPANTPTTAQTPAGLPQGSVLVVEFSSLGGAGRVTQVESPGGTNPTGVGTGGTGGAQAHTQTAANVRPQTAQALLAPGQIVSGLVSGQNPQAQQLTITLPLPPGAPELAQPTTLNIHTPNQLPVGTQVMVRIGTPGAGGIPQGTLMAVTLPSNYNQNQALASFGQRWESLQAGLSQLRGQNPVAAAALVSRLPHLAALGATLLPYLDALQRNDPARAFGREELAILRALGHNVDADFSQLQTLGQPTPEGWRGMLFPYMETPSSDPQQGGFFWRRQKNEDDPQKPASTRFVVQLGLSQLGEVQLDGLIAYPDMWLKLRRKTASEPGFVENLQAVVAATLQSLGLQGGIAVETVGRFDVDPAHEILSHAEAKLSTEA